MRFLPRHARRPAAPSAAQTTASQTPLTVVLRARRRPARTMFVVGAIIIGGFAAALPTGPALAAADSAAVSVADTDTATTAGAGTTATTATTATATSAPGDAVPYGEGGVRTPERAAAGRAVLAAPSPSWPKGVDVASWQHPGGAAINWLSVRNSGMTFAVVKATEGGTYTNPYFAGDRRAAAAAGLVVGAYHFARPALPVSTAVDQARRFLDTVGDVQLSSHFAPVLDLEATGGLGASQLAAWTRAFLEEIETRTGRAPILYTYRSFWTDLVGNSTAFSRYPLWFAIYNDGTTPGRLPGGWKNWAIWQHSPAGRVPGINGDVDLNVLCCTPAAMTALGDGRLSELAKRYASDPAVQWVLGPPTRPEGPAAGSGRWQVHHNGLLFWSVTTGALEVHGSIAEKYLALGGTNGFLRRPLTDEAAGSAAGSRQSVFQGGRIYWSQATDAFEVHGSILGRYLELGGSASHLGLPVSDEYSVPGGRQSAFQRGVLRWDAATGQVTAIGV